MRCSPQRWLQQANFRLVYKPQGAMPALPAFDVHDDHLMCMEKQAMRHAGWQQQASQAAGLYRAATALHSAEQPLRKPIAMHKDPGDA